MKITNPKTDGSGFENFEYDDDAMGARIVETENKKFILSLKEQTGMFTVRADKGPTPDVLKGMYTSQYEAEKAIKQYTASSKKA